ncbi:hypothetical protein QU811_36770, partial [Escherichia coli]|nr:hypothetical protein [Escherichia coli]
MGCQQRAVAWARKNDFSISLPVDRLSFLLAVAT